MTPNTRPLSSTELFDALQPLVRWIVFDDLGTESSQPVQAIHTRERLAAMTPEAFVQALEIAGTTDDVLERFEPADAVLEQLIASNASTLWHQRAAKYVVKLLREHTRDVHVAVVYGAKGSAVHDVYIVGLAAGGPAVGLRTQVIWT